MPTEFVRDVVWATRAVVFVSGILLALDTTVSSSPAFSFLSSGPVPVWGYGVALIVAAVVCTTPWRRVRYVGTLLAFGIVLILASGLLINAFQRNGSGPAGAVYLFFIAICIQQTAKLEARGR